MKADAVGKDAVFLALYVEAKVLAQLERRDQFLAAVAGRVVELAFLAPCRQMNRFIGIEPVDILKYFVQRPDPLYSQTVLLQKMTLYHYE